LYDLQLSELLWSHTYVRLILRCPGIFVPVSEQDGLDELGALLDALKTIEAEIVRHRRLASSQPPITKVLQGDLIPDDDEQRRSDAAATTAAATVVAAAAVAPNASEHEHSNSAGIISRDTLFIIPEEDDEEEEEPESEAESTAVVSTPSTARQSRKRGRTDTEADRVVEEYTDLSCLSLEDLDLRQDCFTVTNNSPHARSLDGCKVESTAGGQIFKFPRGTQLLGGGGRVTVWSGSKNKSKAKQSKRSGGRSDIFWTARYVWNDHGDTAILRGPGEEELDRITTEIVFEQQTEPPLAQAQGADERLEAPESSVDSFLFIANLDLLQERVTICNGGADAVRKQAGLDRHSISLWCGDLCLQAVRLPALLYNAGCNGRLAGAERAGRAAFRLCRHWPCSSRWSAVDYSQRAGRPEAPSGLSTCRLDKRSLVLVSQSQWRQ
jgi:hypothetical protein